MFTATGTLINLFFSPKSEKYEASYKAQLLGDLPHADGQVKKEMLTLNLPKSIFDSLQGQENTEITLPIGVSVINGRLVTFYPKNAAS